MFEYWFLPANGDNHTGATNDFLEICCQLAKLYGERLAGEFLTEMLESHSDKLDYLRVIDWNFEMQWDTAEGPILIKLHKHI